MTNDARTLPAGEVRPIVGGKEIEPLDMDPQAFGDPAEFGGRTFVAEIVGPDGKVHYRRPPGHADVTEAMQTQGYTVRMVGKSDAE